MDRKIAMLFPGQGAQYVGMAKDLYEKYGKVRDLFHRAEEILGEKITHTLFEGPEDELRQTHICQLAIYLHSCAILELIPSDVKPFACAGLSLGEYSALTAAGVFSFEEGLKLVQKRARFMQKAAEAKAGTLAAVIGLDEVAIAGAFAHLSDVWIANLNCPGQVVIGGTIEGIEKAAPVLKELGARRTLPLAVSGAFHTPLMQPAAEELKPYIERTSFHPPASLIAMNAVGDFVSDPAHMRKALFEQVKSPVFFEKSLRNILKAGIDFMIEMGPGKTISGMVRKIDPQVPIFTIDRVEELETFLSEILPASLEES